MTHDSAEVTIKIEMMGAKKCFSKTKQCKRKLHRQTFNIDDAYMEYNVNFI